MRFSLLFCLLPTMSGLAFAEPALTPAPDAEMAFPAIRVEQNQRMLALAVKGDPERNGDSAVKALLRYFFRGAGEAEKNAPVHPRVRWTLRSPAVPRAAWIATYALPVSESFPEPPRGPASILIWQYGLIAESAYTGPYAGARSAIDSLKAYVARSGFSLIGGMEEEYDRGRGTLYQGHPEAYRTLIRYRIREARMDVDEGAPLSAK
jgi:hypothetical protein